MATKRLDISLGPNSVLDSGVFQDLISNQIAAAASPSIGDILAPVLADGGSDEGWKDSFKVPEEYVATDTPKIVVTVLLDGAPGAADTLGFGFRKRAVEDNESGDGTFDAEQVVSVTIGSNDLGYADEDVAEITISLTAANYAANDLVGSFFFLDASGTSYTGNVLVLALEFEFGDA